MVLADVLKKLILGRAFKAEGGRIVILGQYNVSMVESNAMSYLIQKMYEELGKEKTFKIIEECGKIATESALKSFNVKPSLQLFKNMLSFMDFYGWGKFEVVKLIEKGDKLITQIKLTNSPLVEYAKQKFGKNSRVCILFLGNFSGALQKLTGKKPRVKEIACYTKGAPYCLFEIIVPRMKK